MTTIPDQQNTIENCKNEPFISNCISGEITVSNNSNINPNLWVDSSIDLNAGDTIYVTTRGCICQSSSQILTENFEPIQLEGTDTEFLSNSNTSEQSCSSAVGFGDGSINNKIFGTILPNGISPNLNNQTDILLSPNNVGAAVSHTAQKNGRLWLITYSDNYDNDNAYVYCVSVVVNRITPTPTPTSTATPTVTITNTSSTTPTVTQTISATPTITPTISSTPAVTPTTSNTSTPTPTPSISVTLTPTTTVTTTPSSTPQDCNIDHSVLSLYDGEMSFIQNNNRYLYIADGYSGVKIVDSSDLSNPRIIKSLYKNQTVNKISISHTEQKLYIYVDKKISVYDISSPQNASFITDIDLSAILIDSGETTASAIVSDNIGQCYLVSTSGRFIGIDISTSTIINSQLLNNSSYNYAKNTITIDDGYVYVATRGSISGNIFKINQSTLSASNIDITSILIDDSSYAYIYPNSITVLDNYMYMASTTGDVFVLAIDSFSVLSIIYTVGNSIFCLKDWDQDNLFVVNSASALSIYDVSNPTSPSLTNTIDNGPYTSKHVSISDDGRILLLTNTASLQIVKNCITSFRPTPTPTNTVTPSASATPANTPTPTVTQTPTSTTTATPSNTPTITVSPSITPTTTPTNSISATITPTISITPTITPTISSTPTTTPTATPTLSVSATVTPTISVTATITATPAPTSTPTVTSTTTPTSSITPTVSSTVTATPTNTPTATPTTTPINRQNRANYNNAAIWNGAIGNVTTVKTNGGPSFYGTYDQSGLLFEWTDSTFSNNKALRGGAYLSNYTSIGISYRNFLDVRYGEAYLGFRVASSNNIASNVLDMIDIGDTNNMAHFTGFGSVSYEYKISTAMITNAQYVEFLNSIASSSDTYGVYIPAMTSTNIGGIIRHAIPSGYIYTYKTNMGEKPVNYVSWFSAARYCNWLHNGMPSGNQIISTTESGAYALSGATSGIIERQYGAKYYLPNEDEWVKAGFYNSVSNSYTTYATQYNSPNHPTPVSADSDGDGSF